MKEQRKSSTAPAITGCIISFLLVVSFFLPRLWKTNPNIEAINTILIIVILCLSVHLVRISSSLFFRHVWNNIGFLILIFIPVSYLIITALQFVLADPVFNRNVVFNIYLILISLPAFCCYYFTVLWLYGKRDKTLRSLVVILDIFGFVYCLIRLIDKIYLPLALVSGKDVSDLIDVMDKISPYFSLPIYILSFFSFIICAKLFGRDQDNKSN